jgi:tetratricopeptide (TPR) repeat protein
MLETIHEYAAARLREAGESEAARQRHATFYSELAIASEPLLEGDALRATVARLAEESDNLRWALSFGLERDASLVFRIAGAIRRFLLYHDRPDVARECWDYIDAALRTTAEADPVLKAQALFAAGSVALRWRFDDAAVRQLDEAIDLFRALDDRASLATALNNRGVAAGRIDDWPTAFSCYEEAITIYRELGNTDRYFDSLGNLGGIAWQAGDFERGRRALEEAVAGRRLPNLFGQLALLEYCDNNRERSREVALEAFEAAETDAELAAANAPWVLALCELADGGLEEARSLLADQVAYYSSNSDDRTSGGVMLVVAMYGVSVGRDAESLELLGYAESLGVGTMGYELAWREELIRAIDERVEAPVRDALIQRGLTLTQHDALDRARSVLDMPLVSVGDDRGGRRPAPAIEES